MSYHRRVIGFFAAMRMRRQIGAIRFDQQSVRRDSIRDFSQFIRFLECYHPGEADVHSPTQALLGSFPRTTKRVHDSIDLVSLHVRRKRIQHFCFAIPHVDHQRQTRAIGAFDVAGEPGKLNIKRAEIPVPVQSGFAQGDDFGRAQEGFDLFPILFCRVFTFVGDEYLPRQRRLGIDWRLPTLVDWKGPLYQSR
jgi:hypothetical protein